MSPEVSEFTGSGAEWDAFVREQEGWSHYHLHDWKGIIERVFGHECIYLEARDPRGVLTGVLPLVRVKSFIFGHYLVSMPFLNYGGPLGEPAAVESLGEEARALATRDGVELLELRSRIPRKLSLPVSHRRITVLLDLPEEGPEALWNGLRSKVRSQVRRPRKENVEVTFGLDQVAPFFQVFSRHMSALGTPNLPLELFEELADVFSDSVWFACAYYRDEPVACGCGFQWGDELEMTWASDLIEYRKIAPNMLLYWKFMERAAERGLTLFNFGRCTPGSGTHRFKQQWGTRDQTLWWYQHSTDGSEKTPSPEDPIYSLATKAWSRLPLAITRRLGPEVVKYIP